MLMFIKKETLPENMIYTLDISELMSKRTKYSALGCIMTYSSLSSFSL